MTEMQPMNLPAISTHERPREKLLRYGAKALTTAELLAIFLRTGYSQQNVVELATTTLDHFASLEGLFSATQEQFCALKGLGTAKYCQLQAVQEINRRYLDESMRCGDSLSRPRQVRQYLLNHLKGLKNEAFLVVFLNNQHQLLATECLFQGSINSASVYPRVVVQKALQHNAAAVILAHNHPSGIAEPSEADIALTETLTQALQLVEVRVLDHFVVASNQALSMAERGLIGN